MLKLDDHESEAFGLATTELIFSSRSVRNVTISLRSVSGTPSTIIIPSTTPLYIIETPKKQRYSPNTIYKIGKDGQKEHVATLEWKIFTKDLIVLRGERKRVKDVLPMKGFCKQYRIPTLTGEWTWKPRITNGLELFNDSGHSIARYSKHFKKGVPPATMTLNPEGMAYLDMVIIGLLCCRQQIRRRRH